MFENNTELKKSLIKLSYTYNGTLLKKPSKVLNNYIKVPGTQYETYSKCLGYNLYTIYICNDDLVIEQSIYNKEGELLSCFAISFVYDNNTQIDSDVNIHDWSEQDFIEYITYTENRLIENYYLNKT